MCCVQNCDICQKVKVEQRKPPGLIGSIVAVDIMEFPRSKRGFSYLVVYEDFFNKWVEIKPLRQSTGQTIKKSFDDLIITRCGAP